MIILSLKHFYVLNVWFTIWYKMKQLTGQAIHQIKLIHAVERLVAVIVYCLKYSLNLLVELITRWTMGWSLRVTTAGVAVNMI